MSSFKIPASIYRPVPAVQQQQMLQVDPRSLAGQVALQRQMAEHGARYRQERDQSRRENVELKRKLSVFTKQSQWYDEDKSFAEKEIAELTRHLKSWRDKSEEQSVLLHAEREENNRLKRKLSEMESKSKSESEEGLLAIAEAEWVVPNSPDLELEVEEESSSSSEEPPLVPCKHRCKNKAECGHECCKR